MWKGRPSLLSELQLSECRSHDLIFICEQVPNNKSLYTCHLLFPLLCNTLASTVSSKRQREVYLLLFILVSPELDIVLGIWYVRGEYGASCTWQRRRGSKYLTVTDLGGGSGGV